MKIKSELSKLKRKLNFILFVKYGPVPVISIGALFIIGVSLSKYFGVASDEAYPIVPKGFLIFVFVILLITKELSDKEFMPNKHNMYIVLKKTATILLGFILGFAGITAIFPLTVARSVLIYHLLLFLMVFPTIWYLYQLDKIVEKQLKILINNLTEKEIEDFSSDKYEDILFCFKDIFYDKIYLEKLNLIELVNYFRKIFIKNKYKTIDQVNYDFEISNTVLNNIEVTDESVNEVINFITNLKQKTNFKYSNKNRMEDLIRKMKSINIANKDFITLFNENIILLEEKNINIDNYIEALINVLKREHKLKKITEKSIINETYQN